MAWAFDALTVDVSLAKRPAVVAADVVDRVERTQRMAERDFAAIDIDYRDFAFRDCFWFTSGYPRH
jgi:hypothetical protein